LPPPISNTRNLPFSTKIVPPGLDPSGPPPPNRFFLFSPFRLPLFLRRLRPPKPSFFFLAASAFPISSIFLTKNSWPFSPHDWMSFFFFSAVEAVYSSTTSSSFANAGYGCSPRPQVSFPLRPSPYSFLPPSRKILPLFFCRYGDLPLKYAMNHLPFFYQFPPPPRDSLPGPIPSRPPRRSYSSRKLLSPDCM